jgi:hypothetical protein
VSVVRILTHPILWITAILAYLVQTLPAAGLPTTISVPAMAAVAMLTPLLGRFEPYDAGLAVSLPQSALTLAIGLLTVFSLVVQVAGLAFPPGSATAAVIALLVGLTKTLAGQLTQDDPAAPDQIDEFLSHYLGHPLVQQLLAGLVGAPPIAVAPSVTAAAPSVVDQAATSGDSAPPAAAPHLAAEPPAAA